MSQEALIAIVLNEIEQDDTLNQDERIRRAIDIALSLIDISLDHHR